jgi:CHAT domain-containing protein
VLPGAIPGLLGLNRSNLRGLASTESEVRSIAEFFRGQSIVVAGKEATESRFKSEPLSEVEVVHLALHGVADSAFPDRAALIFAGAGDKQDDGLLQAREIRKLPLHAELVTLSACDAGIGRIEGEEGFSSLIEAFLNAGARSVVASLWAAEDTYTKSLMQSFYRHLNEGQSKKEALRVAKMDMLREFGDQTAPLYWAGFILVGDGKGTITPGGGQ